jgi:hypothetical protein
MKESVGITRDEGTQFSTYQDPDKGTFILDHESKSYRTIPLPKIAERKPDDEASPQELRQYKLLEESAKMAYTGRERKIGNWNCREFVILDTYGSEMPEYLQSSIVAWIADDFENGKEIQNRKFAVSPDGMMSQLQAIIGKKWNCPGPPYRW